MMMTSDLSWDILDFGSEELLKTEELYLEDGGVSINIIYFFKLQR
jgi:hypothetical protein